MESPVRSRDHRVDQVRVFNPIAAVGAVVLLLFFSAAALVGLPERGDGIGQPDWWLGVVFVVAPLVMAARGVVVGAVVTDSEVWLRGWIRTRRIPREHVTGVKTKRYSGNWNADRRSRTFRMLAIKTSGGTVDVPAVAARRAKAERLAAKLRTALAISE